MQEKIFLVFLYIFLVFLFWILTRYLSKIDLRKQDKVCKGERFISEEEFMKDWITEMDGRKCISGYKAHEFSGCYVILIFESPVTDGCYLGYDDIYIGQSVNVTKRVHQHFSGKGNGDVYADIKYGKSVYVLLVPCEREEMNDLEKALISEFESTDSYNATSGGGINWEEESLIKRLFKRR